MWKTIVIILLIGNISSAKDHQSHLQKLKREFPYGLVTDDFGILNRKDLKINACIANPVPFTDENMYSPYPRWQCFDGQKIKMTCERGKYDQHAKLVMSMLVISSERDGEIHEYISRRPIALISCRLYKKDWLKLTKNQKHICVSGHAIFKEIERSEAKWTWIWGRYKTKKGCDSYFADECNRKGSCDDS